MDRDSLQQQVAALTRQLDALRRSHNYMTVEISRLEKELNGIRQLHFSNHENTDTPLPAAVPSMRPPAYPAAAKPAPERPAAPQRSLEGFIGTNLISKAGILITIIGIFIGAKYAIDNQLIGEGMRVTLGYVSAGILAGIGFRLKSRYSYFSAVLMGGGIAVVYFITYIAYSFYHFFPAPVAFLFMLLTTAAAVGLALWFNQKIIAFLGQLAAYCIPLLLSDGSGRVGILFTYISIINAGLIILSFKKDWKLLYRTAFIITWLLYAGWLLGMDGKQLDYGWGLLFIAVAFVTFYLTFLSYKILRKELYNTVEISLLLFNALAFYTAGYYLLSQHFGGTGALTFFTLINAVIHIAAGFSIYQAKLADSTVNQFISGLGLLFITIAVPVKLDGSWVTLLWSTEAAILVFIANRNERRLYYDVAIPVIIAAVLSLLQDWSATYPSFVLFEPAMLYDKKPFLHPAFFISLISCASFFYIAYTATKGLGQLKAAPAYSSRFYNSVVYLLFTGLLYLSFFNEINFLFDKIVYTHPSYPAYDMLRTLALLIYSLLFISGCLTVNTLYIKRQVIHILLAVAALVVIMATLTGGLFTIGEMRSFFLQGRSPYWLIYIRYACIAAVTTTLLTLYYSNRRFLVNDSFKKTFSISFNITALTLVCNEYVSWLDLAGYPNQYKLGISIICGCYALVLLFIGLIKGKAHLRIGAITLFGITLIKLFAYDLASLSTISKTIVMILLGALLLAASFLYNKYKDRLAKQA